MTNTEYQGFHWRDEHFWMRLPDGSVRHRWPGGESVIPPNEWASIVAVVSANGEGGVTYRQALAFHNGGCP